MNQYVRSVEAALRATAPYVAIPVDGHAPACVKGKLLKGALKGVTVTSVKIITADPASDSGRWLEIKGRAEGGVRTSCKVVTTSVRDYQVRKQMQDWTAKERDKRIKVVSQGILNPAERKALKLKEAMAREEKSRNAELIAAQREEAEIIEEAKASVFPEITPVDPEKRAEIVARYSAFRACRSNRKRGAAIRWKLKTLREQVKSMTTEKREYEEREPQSPMHSWHRRRRSLKSVTKVLRRKKDAVKYAAAVYQIARLEEQYKALYPLRHMDSEYVNEGRGYWVDSFPEKHPSEQTYRVCGWQREWDGTSTESDGELKASRIKRLADRLRVARANIRALTPPATEDEEELPIAA